MKCAICDAEHDSVMLSPACHPGKPMHISAVEHPERKGELTLEVRCSKCDMHVAYFSAKRIYIQ